MPRASRGKCLLVDDFYEHKRFLLHTTQKWILAQSTYVGEWLCAVAHTKKRTKRTAEAH